MKCFRMLKKIKSYYYYFFFWFLSESDEMCLSESLFSALSYFLPEFFLGVFFFLELKFCYVKEMTTSALSVYIVLFVALSGWRHCLVCWSATHR